MHAVNLFWNWENREYVVPNQWGIQTKPNHLYEEKYSALKEK